MCVYANGEPVSSSRMICDPPPARTPISHVRPGTCSATMLAAAVCSNSYSQESRSNVMQLPKVRLDGDDAAGRVRDGCGCEHPRRLEQRTRRHLEILRPGVQRGRFRRGGGEIA